MGDFTPEGLRRQLQGMLSSGALQLPLPAGGCTTGRLFALHEFGRADLSLARLAEAHTDAVAILKESGRDLIPGALYGVWASDGPASRLDGTVDREGGLHLRGTKLYCSGAGIVDAALVTVHTGDGLELVELRLDGQGIELTQGGWQTPAFAATCTRTVQFDHHVRAQARVGGPGWYLNRVGFWHGALGPAACWAGGATALVEAAIALSPTDPHARAQTGALQAAGWALSAYLEKAGNEVDAAVADGSAAQRRALIARHLIERTCAEVLDRFGRATGPRLLAFDQATARRHAELTLYIRQCHAERDLEELARAR